MSIGKRILSVSLASFTTLYTPARAAADPVILTFENIGNFRPIGGFYNGGPGGDFGITFDNTALALVDTDAGGGGFFANEPSPSSVLYFPNAGAAYVDVERGFQNEVSFLYSQPFDPTQPNTVYSHFSVAVFEGFGGSGRELGRWMLSSTDPHGIGDPTGDLFGSFMKFRGIFGGTGRSVGFFEPISTTGAVFDDLQFALAPTPIPEPSTLVLLLGGAVMGIRALKQSVRR
jgi:hypothetical protein